MPNGPADKHLEPGDVLIRVNGKVSHLNFTSFSEDCFFVCLEQSRILISLLQHWYETHGLKVS